MNTISAYHHAARLEDQASSLLDKISEFRLANYADQSIDWDRLKRFHRAVFRRYQRRAAGRQAAFEAYLNEFEKYKTQQIASAVEREAFPDSGDTFAAPLVNAPELAQAGQGSNQVSDVYPPRECLYCHASYVPFVVFGELGTVVLSSYCSEACWHAHANGEQRAEQGSGSFSPCRIAEHRRAFQRRFWAFQSRFWWYRDLTLASVTPSRLRGVSILSQVADSSRGVRYV